MPIGACHPGMSLIKCIRIYIKPDLAVLPMTGIAGFPISTLAAGGPSLSTLACFRGNSHQSIKIDVQESVKIGSQVWMTRNLDVSTFRNGNPIPQAETSEQWKRAYHEGQPAWCSYDNKPENGNKYGKLYSRNNLIIN